MRELFRKIAGILYLSGRDAKVMIVSLLLAYGIWLIHNLTLNYTEVIKVPVTAHCDIEGHAAESSNSAVVLARCRTSGFRLIQFAYAEHRAPVVVNFNVQDMRRKSAEIFYVTNDDLNKYVNHIFGAGTKLEAFVSDTLMFRFPEENHKKVPVQAVYSIDFQSQYTGVGEFKVVPDSVTIYGEPYHIESIEKVFTKQVNLSDVNSSIHGSVELDKIKGVRISTDAVVYSLNVSRFVEVTASVPVYVRNVPRGKSLVVYPSTAQVTFRCAFPVTSDPSSSVRIYVDYNDFVKSLHGQCIPYMEQVPAGVLDYEVKPIVFDCVESGK